jgi:hypothetical protein
MAKFVIERNIPGAGDLTWEQLQAAAQKSCSVLDILGPDVHWLHSYVTDDKLYCVYASPDEELIKVHAERSGFVASRISEVRALIDPTTATVHAAR